MAAEAAEPENPPEERDQAEGAYRKALELLARRSHFASEITRKLHQRGFAPAAAQAAVERLEAARLLDDRRTARELLEERLRRGPEGRRRLRAELERRGAPPDVVSEVLAESLTDEDERGLARRAAEAFRRGRRGSDPRALARHLERLGFPTRDILALAEELQDRTSSDDGC